VNKRQRKKHWKKLNVSTYTWWKYEPPPKHYKMLLIDEIRKVFELLKSANKEKMNEN
jgi:hypothetical protein